MRLPLVLVGIAASLTACGGSKGAPDANPVDAAPPDASPYDGAYGCTTDQFGGDSCSAPLFDSGIQASWPLVMAGGDLTITSAGFDQPTLHCTGSWDAGGVFTCNASWTRAGRVCMLPLHLRLEADQTLTFWINTITTTTASCTKT